MASSDRTTKNEVDFISIANKWLINDAEVLNTFSIGSDHRLVRTKVVINLRSERYKTIKKKKKTNWLPLDCPEKYRTAVTKQVERHQLENRIVN